jgi:hypothetical protein
MFNEKKSIVCVIIIVIVIIAIVCAVVMSNSKKKSKNVEKAGNVLTQEEALDKIEDRLKDKLAKNGLTLNESASGVSSLYGQDGTQYTVYDANSNGDIQENTIEVYLINIDIIKELGQELNNKEVTIDNEKYLKYESALIKECKDEGINNKIKEAIEK